MTDNCSHCNAPIQPVEIEVVLDRSGSMATVRDDAIGGFNTWLREQQNAPGDANLTVTLFDDQIETAPSCPLNQGKALDTSSYVPRGMTALYDATSRALARLEAKNASKSILVILTDGQENASRETNKQQLMTRIERAQKRGWQVVYLSASPSAFSDAAALGVLRGSTVAFNHDSRGVQSAYATMSTSNTNYRATGNANVVLPDDGA